MENDSERGYGFVSEYFIKKGNSSPNVLVSFDIRSNYN